MRIAAAATIAGLTFLLAACGGDDGDAKAFRADANAICAEYWPKIAAVPPPLEAPDEWAAVAGDRGDLLEAAVNRLRELEPPGDLGDQYDEWLELKGRSLEATRDLQEAGATLDEGRIAEALGQLTESDGEAVALADELGLHDCATSPASDR